MPIQSLENKTKLVLHTRWSLTLPPIPEQLFSTNSDTFLTWLKAEGRLRCWPLPSSPASLYVAHVSAPHLSDVLWMLSHTAKSSAFYEKSLWLSLQAGNSLSNGQGGFFSLQPPCMRHVLKNKFPCPSAYSSAGCKCHILLIILIFLIPPWDSQAKCDVEIFGWTLSDPVCPPSMTLDSWVSWQGSFSLVVMCLHCPSSSATSKAVSPGMSALLCTIFNPTLLLCSHCLNSG